MGKFYLGMDIGSDSVGMACTDENYDLLRAKGKDLWAVRLFDQANPSKDRRIKRTARRRLARRKYRIELLQGLFAPLIEDNLFFIRLNNSGFYEEDKDRNLNTRFSLFADSDYTDVEFYHEYPTIFHLRKALIDGTYSKVDLRHYYLAIHHIIKYRGHFLFEGENISEVRDIKKLFIELDEVLNRYFGVEDELEELHWIDKAETFKTIAMDNNGINDKKKASIALFAANSSELKEIVSLLVGAKAKPSILFGEENAERFKEEKPFSFRDITDEKFEAFQEVYDDEQFEILQKVRAIYNFIVFEKILDGTNNISDAMVGLYEKHHNDLILLKKLIKENCSKEVYYKLFRSVSEDHNYCNYIGYTKIGREKVFVEKKCSYKDFAGYLKKVLSYDVLKNNADAEKIIVELENGKFLPKILNADNGLFPHQINGMELKAILKNLCKDYPEFAVAGEDGYSLCDKINKIFLYKIPYYVGPLNGVVKDDGTRTNWVVKKSEEKITPWNFNDVVDKSKSSECFIRRMTNKCTYLHCKDVLPKQSMYYQAYDVLNTINKLTIGTVPLTVDEKQSIFNDLYRKHKNVTAKNIEIYLVASGRYTKAEISSNPLGGYDKEIGLKVNLSSYVTFKKILGDLVDSRPDIVENIILWHTLNDDKSLVEDAILNNYGDIPEIKNNIRSLKSLSGFKDFGRLSKELLIEMKAVNKETGEVCTFLGELYNTNYNFNQLLFLDSYTFSDEIKSVNNDEDGEITETDIDTLYVSPMVKRGIKQALRMTDEYVKAVGKAPDKIFIEVTRHEGEKKRTESRKQKLLKKYKEITDHTEHINKLIAMLNRDEMTDMKLRSERLYLYFLQLGRCAYSGELIDIEQLGSDLYDVDHIMPQSKTKDDGLENKVLVKRVKNFEKGDTYPLPVGFTNQQGFWSRLKEKGLMSEKKYALLTRTNPLNENDFKSFVARQLVVTDQTAMAVKELLEKKYEKFGTKIVLSKAANVSDFRQKYDIVKCRETNDLHHARDAYFNIVVGNVYDTKFTSAHDYYALKQDDSWREYNLKHLFDKPIKNAWNGKEDIPRIKKIAAKTSMTVTRYCYTYGGMFYKETILKQYDKAISYPRKNCYPYNIVDENGRFKYGGYTKVQNAYFVALDYLDKKQRKKIVLGMPVIVECDVKGDKSKIKRYYEESVGLKDVHIIVPKIKIGSLISYNGYKAYITGASDSRIILQNAIEWFTSERIDLYVKNIFKLINKMTTDTNNKVVSRQNSYEMNVNRFGQKKVVVNKENNLKLYDDILRQIRNNDENSNNLKYYAVGAYADLYKKLNENRSKFESLSVFEQTNLLCNIVGFMRRGGSTGVDLSLIGESKNTCILRVGYNITDVDFAIIHRSPCGLTERIQKV